MKKNTILLLLLFCFIRFISFGDSFGNGSDGSPSIGGIVNIYTQVLAISNDTCNTDLTVSSSSGFFVGDLVLVIQTQGATINNTNTSTYGCAGQENDNVGTNGANGAGIVILTANQISGNNNIICASARRNTHLSF